MAKQTKYDSNISGINTLASVVGEESYWYLRRGEKGSLTDTEIMVLQTLKKLKFPYDQSGTYYFAKIINDMIELITISEGTNNSLEEIFTTYTSGIVSKVKNECIAMAYPKNLGNIRDARRMQISSNTKPMDAAWNIAKDVVKKVSQQDSQTAGNQPFTNSSRPSGAYVKAISDRR